MSRLRFIPHTRAAWSRARVWKGQFDQVVFRGDIGAREFIAFWLADGRVLAGMNVNVWDVTDDLQRLIRSGTAVDPDRLAAPAVPLSQLC